MFPFLYKKTLPPITISIIPQPHSNHLFSLPEIPQSKYQYHPILDPLQETTMMSSANTMSVLIGGLLEVLLQVDRKRIHRFFQQLRLRSHVQSVSINSDDDRRDSVRAADKEVVKQTTSVERIEVGTVLRSLGLFGDSEAEEISVEADVISGIFDEQNPSLDEVKEAFGVFDVNKDGFIDADELLRVLLALGLRQGPGVDECRKMIGLHDENGDGVMDFDEFVRFMETVPC